MCPAAAPPDGPNDSPPPLSPLIPGRGGRPAYSLDALRERVERQFFAETAGRDDILAALDTADEQRALLAEITDYLLALESITLDGRSRAALIEAAHAHLFGWGPLDALIADAAVSEITVNGPTTIAIRRGPGRLEHVAARFDDAAHLERVAERLLGSSPGENAAAAEIVERGIALDGRPARVTAVAPPLSAALSLHIRLHPREPIPLEALHVPHGALPAAAIPLLRAIIRGGWGTLIVGEAGTGKTTLAAALAELVPPAMTMSAAERAAELRLPAQSWRHAASPGQPFADALRAALEQAPGWLVVDELRGDPSDGLWDALTRAPAVRGVWLWRGAIQPDRLRSALNIAIRREEPALPQRDLDAACAAQFAFIVALKATAEGPRLAYLAETRLEDGALRIAPLIERHDQAWRLTGEQPVHALDLPDTFWTGPAPGP